MEQPIRRVHNRVYRLGLLALSALGLLISQGNFATAQEGGGEAPPAPYDLVSIDCGELDNEGGLLSLRKSHTAGEDMDLLCKVKVELKATSKGTPKGHTVTFTVFQDKKTTYQQVRDARILSVGARTILFVVPAEKLPTEGGKVRVRAELSKPANKPAFREVEYELNAED